MKEQQQIPDLTGSQVSVTHSGEGAQWLIQAFRQRHAAVHHVPLIQFQLLTVPRRLKNLNDVQWLVLTSPQGVHALSSALNTQEVPPHLKWAAVGESTARAMQQAGMPVHFIPSQATGTALGQELPLNTSGTVLHLTSDQSKNDLPEAVQARGGQYERAVLYRTIPREPTQAQLPLLLRSDVVTLASSSAAQQFAALGGQHVPVAVMGHQTAETARDLGFQNILTAQQPTLNALKETVLEFLRSRGV